MDEQLDCLVCRPNSRIEMGRYDCKENRRRMTVFKCGPCLWPCGSFGEKDYSSGYPHHITCSLDWPIKIAYRIRIICTIRLWIALTLLGIKGYSWTSCGEQETSFSGNSEAAPWWINALSRLQVAQTVVLWTKMARSIVVRRSKMWLKDQMLVPNLLSEISALGGATDIDFSD